MTASRVSSPKAWAASPGLAAKNAMTATIRVRDSLPAVRNGRGPLGFLGSLELFSSVDAFKGPMDVAGANGNFGLGMGLNLTIPVARRLGIGFQAGTNVIMSDFHGTLFTNSGIRTQNFTSLGFFQRVPQEYGSLNWGFTYDWLFDDYYDKFNFGQWRVKLGWENE